MNNEGIGILARSLKTLNNLEYLEIWDLERTPCTASCKYEIKAVIKNLEGNINIGSRLNLFLA